MVKKFVRTFLIVLFALHTLPVYAEFYSVQKGKGYYQYQKFLQDNASKKYPRPEVPDNATLMSMPTQDFQKLVTETLSYALTERNLDTYADYARIQQHAFKRAEEFGSLHVLYGQLNPPADENEYNRVLHDKERNQAIATTLKANKSEYGLIYFYSTTCAYCVQQTPLIQMFQERYGWEIEAVDINEKPNVAASFQVEITPTIKMVDRNRNVFPISNGVITLPDMEERAYRYIRYSRGETTDTTFQNILK
ncbi:MAG: conjugal transfer protein TraF [Deferribacteraceae bacterium]|jgi:conjugal transfer pilus assembly protein TraF|nr:conjugal transfer protein TraF [Deferribacteraceae bacterium]